MVSFSSLLGQIKEVTVLMGLVCFLAAETVAAEVSVHKSCLNNNSV